LTISNLALPPLPFDQALQLRQLSWMLQNQGKYELAVAVNRRALRLREKMSGLDDLETLASVRDVQNSEEVQRVCGDE